MAKTPEGQVKDHIKNFFNKYSIPYRMVVPCGYGQNGISDFIGILVDGTFIAIEAKPNDKKDPTPLQKKFLKEISDNNGIAAVIGSKDSLDKLEQSLVKRGLIFTDDV